MKKSGLLAIALALTFVLSVTPMPVAAATYTIKIYPVEDTYATQDSATSNYGTSSALVVGTGIEKNKRTFLKFNLSSVPANATSIVAKIKLYQYSSLNPLSGVSTVEARQITKDSWTESVVVWYGGMPLYVNWGSTAVERQVTVDRVIDGDTIVAGGVTYRLVSIQTPEVGEPGYENAKNWTDYRCPVGSTVAINVDNKRPTDSYGRTLAVVYYNKSGSWYNLNKELVTKGYAVEKLSPPSEFEKSSTLITRVNTVNGWNSITVSSYVAAQNSGDDVASIMLKTQVESYDGTTRASYFYSDEQGGSYTPYLEVTYTV